MKLLALITTTDALALASIAVATRALWLVLVLLVLGLVVLVLDSRRHSRVCSVAADVVGVVWLLVAIVGLLLL